jgi:hypothetical protein
LIPPRRLRRAVVLCLQCVSERVFETADTPRPNGSASIVSSSAVDRANRLGFVTISIAVPQEREALGQFGTLCDAGNLLGEQLDGTRGLEVALTSSPCYTWGCHVADGRVRTTTVREHRAEGHG